MANVYGTNATEAFVTAGGTVQSAKAGGRIRSLVDTYEAAALAATSNIIIGGKTLPAGAEILPSSFIQFDDLGTGVTADLILVAVDGAAEITIVADVDVAASAVTLDFSAIANIGALPVTVAAESYLAIKIGDAAATGTIVANIEYVID